MFKTMKTKKKRGLLFLVLSALLGIGGISVFAGSSIASPLEETRAATTWTDVFTPYKSSSDKGTLSGITSNGYTAFTADKNNTGIESNVTYAGKAARYYQNEIYAIQFNTNKNGNGSGIYSTTSDAYIRSVSVVWTTNTASGKVLNVYANDAAYTAVSTTYKESGSLRYGDTETTYTFVGDYKYVCIAPKDGATYFESITFNWEAPSSDPAITADESLFVPSDGTAELKVSFVNYTTLPSKEDMKINYLDEGYTEGTNFNVGEWSIDETNKTASVTLTGVQANSGYITISVTDGTCISAEIFIEVSDVVPDSLAWDPNYYQFFVTGEEFSYSNLCRSLSINYNDPNKVTTIDADNWSSSGIFVEISEDGNTWTRATSFSEAGSYYVRLGIASGSSYVYLQNTEDFYEVISSTPTISEATTYISENLNGYKTSRLHGTVTLSGIVSSISDSTTGSAVLVDSDDSTIAIALNGWDTAPEQFTKGARVSVTGGLANPSSTASVMSYTVGDYKTITGLEITKAGKTEYVEYDQFDAKDYSFQIVYSDGTTEAVADSTRISYIVSGQSADKILDLDDKSVVFTYTDPYQENTVSVTQEITVGINHYVFSCATTVEMNCFDSQRVDLTLSDGWASSSEIIWVTTCSPEGMLDVTFADDNSYMTIKANSAGTASLKIELSDGANDAPPVTVDVTVKEQAISLNTTSVALEKDDSQTLTVTASNFSGTPTLTATPESSNYSIEIGEYTSDNTFPVTVKALAKTSNETITLTASYDTGAIAGSPQTASATFTLNITDMSLLPGKVSHTITVSDITSSSYSDHLIDKDGTDDTGIVYDLYCYPNTSSGIQLNNDNRECGLAISSNENGYILAELKVTYNGSSDKNLSVYGRSTKYTNVADLYDDPGTSIGTITTSSTTVFPTTGYSFFGFTAPAGKGAFYLASIEITWYTPHIFNFASDFLAKTSAVCLNDGSTDQSNLATCWSGLADTYPTSAFYDNEVSVLTSETADESGNIIAQAMARYDFIVGKYGADVTANFLGRTITPKSAHHFYGVSEDASTYVTILSVAGGAILAGGAFFAFKRKKEKAEEE